MAMSLVVLLPPSSMVLYSWVLFQSIIFKSLSVLVSLCLQNLYHFVPQQQQQQEVCHIVALPFTLKGILRQKKNYEN